VPSSGHVVRERFAFVADVMGGVERCLVEALTSSAERRRVVFDVRPRQPRTRRLRRGRRTWYDIVFVAFRVRHERLAFAAGVGGGARRF
jgi:hypothetical protein